MATRYMADRQIPSYGLAEILFVGVCRISKKAKREKRNAKLRLVLFNITNSAEAMKTKQNKIRTDRTSESTLSFSFDVTLNSRNVL